MFRTVQGQIVAGPQPLSSTLGSSAPTGETETAPIKYMPDSGVGAVSRAERGHRHGAQERQYSNHMEGTAEGIGHGSETCAQGCG